MLGHQLDTGAWRGPFFRNLWCWPWKNCFHQQGWFLPLIGLFSKPSPNKQFLILGAYQFQSLFFSSKTNPEAKLPYYRQLGAEIGLNFLQWTTTPFSILRKRIQIEYWAGIGKLAVVKNSHNKGWNWLGWILYASYGSHPRNSNQCEGFWGRFPK